MSFPIICLIHIYVHDELPVIHLIHICLRQIDRIFRRVADVLKIPEELLHVTRSAEDIQVVHYDVGQEYFAHHDWQASDKPNTRFATLLLYLDTPAEGAGGETGFPLAFNAKGLHLRPPQVSRYVSWSVYFTDACPLTFFALES
jgi:hypothetical protein